MTPEEEARIVGIVAGKVESGTMSRASNATFWAEIKGAIEETGLDWNRGVGDIVRSLRSGAVARREAYRRFQNAKDEALFIPQLRAADLNVRSAAVQQIQPQYLMRFDLTFTGPDGQTQTKTVSMRDDIVPGLTKGQVLDAVAETAEALARDYGTGLVGYGNLRPVTI